MAAGYIYVLVNSSLPDLVKVGKTTRLPSERAKELSGATGVPTPFVVAFEERFADCDSAEDAVHSELEACGFRQSQNREFFRAKPSEVIRTIMEVASRSPTTSVTIEVLRDEAAPPWADLLHQADDLLEGTRSELQDTHEALRLYKLAARMGSPEACRALGDIYFFGFQARKDHEEALLWFKEAAKRGEYLCYIKMARIFFRHDQRENAVKCFEKFFEAHGKWLDSLPPDPNRHSYDVEQYLHLCLDNNVAIEFREYIDIPRASILARVEPRLQDQLSPNESQELTRVRDMLLRTVRPDYRFHNEDPADSSQGLLAPKQHHPTKPGFFRRLFSGG